MHSAAVGILNSHYLDEDLPDVVPHRTHHTVFNVVFQWLAFLVTFFYSFVTVQQQDINLQLTTNALYRIAIVIVYKVT